MTQFHLMPIRHHGPGSARSVVRALDHLRPACLLVEGPPDAADVLPLASDPAMQPPVSILIYEADKPANAVFYPFAVFSPEWNAIRWAQANGVPVRFFDLPQSNRMVAKAEPPPADATPAEGEETAEPPAITPALIRADPLGELAKAAGFDDGERWWEHVVEHRREAGAEADLAVFAEIGQAMGALRENGQTVLSDDPLRESHMRRVMREVEKEGFASAAVVCGAFHAPALLDLAGTKKADDAALKSLAKVKTTATWVPWTHELLATRSGYGAGVHSPGWYEHVFQHPMLVVERWMTRVARLLRDEDVDCSSAHVIEAVRLASALAAMRARPLPDLSDIADATRSVFCYDGDGPMRLIGRKLLVGDVIGDVPDATPQVPLQRDLAQKQKSLRLKPEAAEKKVELDLRTETDLARSQLLHRLRLIGIHWGVPQTTGPRAKGTFKEAWQLRWDPHFAIALVQAARHGNTVADAATGAVRQRLAEASADLPTLAKMLDTLLLADLPDALDAVLRQVDAVAAVASDVAALMDAVPPLARAARYGTVRQTDTALLGRTLAGILPRVTAGLPVAVGSLNDEAAAAFARRIVAVAESVSLLASDAEPSPDAAEFERDWTATLEHVCQMPNTHGHVQGKAARLLFDGGRLSSDAIDTALSLALSRATDPTHAAAWLQGFLEGSGLILTHDPKLLATIDGWVGSIAAETFDAVLPLLRRTFATFEAPERRQIGQQLSRGKKAVAGPVETGMGIDEVRAARVLPTLRLIFGAAR